MRVIETLSNLPMDATDAIVVIGNFDGVHIGHQALLSRARSLAEELNKKLAVLTFEPHPRRLFRPDDPPFRITPVSTKHMRLQACGVDMVYSLPFDWDFASQSAEEFIQNVLTDGIVPAHIIVGDDFCFGQLRKGTAETLKDAGYEVTVVTKIKDTHGIDFSSSDIRQALRKGEIKKANEMLGWDWEMRGEIVKGDQRGRELGYPTANVQLQETLHPAYGVYATLVKLADEGDDAPWMAAATNIGIRPMFELKIGQVEAHILDFDRDIYGKTLRIKPIKKLRGEAKFDSLDELITQIDKDCAATRSLLS